MKTALIASLVVFGALGCDPATPAEVFSASVDRVTALTVSSQSFGVAPPACANRSRRYNFALHTLTLTECASTRTVTARAADSTELRNALRSVTIRSTPCDGFDGTNTSVAFEYGAGTQPTGYGIGAASCSGGPSAARAVDTIDPASWAPAQAILDRVANGG